MHSAVDGSKRVGEHGAEALSYALSTQGLTLDLGGARIRVRAPGTLLPRQLRAAYPNHPLLGASGWADFYVQLRPPSGPRRLLRSQVLFESEGRRPFEPFPASHALALFEWGSNWLIGQTLNDLLLLHAGAVERQGRVLVMPATPGSGKSTLTAALALSGWRLLSDEFGAFDPESRRFRAMLKPLALKNASIDVITQRFPQAVIGPRFEKTRKGTVAHLAANMDSVARRHERTLPGAIVFPRWVEGAPLSLSAVPPETAFSSLAFNAFNYGVLGAVGFEAVLHLTRTCPAFQLVYGHLDDALATLDRLWADTFPAQGDVEADDIGARPVAGISP